MKLSAYYNKSLMMSMLILFIPLITVSVLVSGSLIYALSAKQINENAYIMLEDSLNQTGLIVEDKLSVMFEELLKIERDRIIQNIVFWQGAANGNDSERLHQLIEMKQKMNAIYNQHSQIIDSIYVTFNNGTEFHLQQSSIPTGVGLDLDEWVATYTGAQRGYYWLNSHEDAIFRTTKGRNVLSVFKIIGDPQSAFKGIVLLNMKADYFISLLEKIKIGENGYLALTSDEETLLFAEVPERYVLNEQDLRSFGPSGGPDKGSFNATSVTGEQMFVSYEALKINNWRLTAVIPESDLHASASQIKMTSFTIIVLLIALTSMLTIFFANRLSRSIRYLSTQVRKVEEGNFLVKFDVEENNEIRRLGQGLTSLVSTVRHLLVQIKEEQERKKQLELMVLQSQINPHFLYNTLTSIQYLIESRSNDKAGKMLKAVSNLYRIVISRGKQWITVRDEVMHIENYLIIQKMRYSQSFDYSIEISGAIMDYYVTKLILQPVVENAIYHGIKNKRGKGNIAIKGIRQGAAIVFEVFDDGAGIERSKLARLNDTIRQKEMEREPITFGLKNVHQRIQHHGAAFGIVLESEYDEYTKVTITVPLLKQPGEEANTNG